MNLLVKFSPLNRSDVGTLIPPEGVPLHLDIAGLGVRLAAQVTDVLISLLAAISLLILVISLGLSSPNTIFAIASLLFFLIRVPYYVFSELLWNGQTPGKCLMKIKVVSHEVSVVRDFGADGGVI